MPLPSRLTVVSKPAASTSPAVDFSSASVEAHAVLLGGDELAEQVVARVPTQVVEVVPQPLVELAQRRLDAAELPPGEPEVEAGRRRGAEAEHRVAVASPGRRGSPRSR